MTKEELTAWGLKNGWQMIDGSLVLTKPSSPKEAIVRLVFKISVVSLEVKKPAGKWEKMAGAAYSAVVMNEERELPEGLGLESFPGFSMLMRDNKDRQVFGGMK